MSADDEWIELRRFDDPLRAEMTRNFLVDHGVRVGLRGHPGVTAVLNRFTTVVDIRLDVPRSDVEAAREAIEALEASDVSEQPFRGKAPRSPSSEDDDLPAKRSGLVAAVLALIVPIGAGHFYARHGAAGMIFFVAIAAGALGAFVGGRPELLRAAGMVVLLDAALSLWAVKRHNERRVPPEGVQRRWALAGVLVAFVAAFVA